MLFIGESEGVVSFFAEDSLHGCDLKFCFEVSAGHSLFQQNQLFLSIADLSELRIFGNGKDKPLTKSHSQESSYFIVVIMIVALIHIAQFDTNGVLTSLYIIALIFPLNVSQVKSYTILFEGSCGLAGGGRGGRGAYSQTVG